ncbi:MAG: serine hydrolase [Desulfurococcaceae archaeon]
MSFNSLEKFILERISKYRMPGLSIALLKNDEIVYAKGFGFKDVEFSQPPTPYTNYCVGSVTKAFTALAVMQLYEKGLLSVDDPVNRYVSTIKAGNITIHHLLTHTSGIPALGYAEALINSYYGLGGIWLPISAPDSILAFMEGYEDWILFKPSERWFYLNEGYVMLGKIIEKVTGLKYEEYVKRNLLDKIGMDKSYFTREEYLKDTDRATPYNVSQDGKLIKVEPIFGISADGGLFSNAVDLLKFAKAMIGRGRYGDTQLVGSKLIELMETPHVKLPYESPTSRYYGYGLTIHDDFQGRKLVGHSGSVLVYTAYLGYIPDEGVAVTVLSNSSGYPLSLIGAYALTLLLGRKPEEALHVIKQEELLERLEGVYTGFKNTIGFKVKRVGGTLLLEDVVRKTQIPIYPERLTSEHALFYAYGLGVKIPVEFVIEANRVIMIYERYVSVKTGALTSGF